MIKKLKLVDLKWVVVSALLISVCLHFFNGDSNATSIFLFAAFSCVMAYIINYFFINFFGKE
jgi:hypothetical protein